MTMSTKKSVKQVVQETFKLKRNGVIGGSESQLLEYLMNEKWIKAVERVTKYPHEARMLSNKDDGGGGGGLPLHVALKQGAPYVVIEALVKAYPQSVGMMDQRTMRTPLNLAALFDKSNFWYETFSLLYVKYKDAASLSDKYGRIPLHYLAYRNKLKGIELMLQHDIQLGCIQDKDGFTPSHVAAQYKHTKGAFDLLGKLCPLSMKQECDGDDVEKHKTPVALAKEFNQMKDEERQRRCKQLSAATTRSTRTSSYPGVGVAGQKRRQQKEMDAFFTPPTVEEMKELQPDTVSDVSSLSDIGEINKEDDDDDDYDGDSNNERMKQPNTSSQKRDSGVTRRGIVLSEY